MMLERLNHVLMFVYQSVLRKGLPFAVLVGSKDNDDLLLPCAKRQAAMDVVHES